MNQNPHDKFFLSTEGYYFKYRKDNNNPEIVRATLYRTKNDERVDDVCVSENWGVPEKSHHDVIKYFESRLHLGTIS